LRVSCPTLTLLLLFFGGFADHRGWGGGLPPVNSSLRVCSFSYVAYGYYARGRHQILLGGSGIAEISINKAVLCRSGGVTSQHLG
jgi:hypothetical protein